MTRALLLLGPLAAVLSVPAPSSAAGPAAPIFTKDVAPMLYAAGAGSFQRLVAR